MLVGMQVVHPPKYGGESMEAPRNIKNRTTYDPAISFLSIGEKKPKALIQKDKCIPMFIAALFTIVTT